MLATTSSLDPGFKRQLIRNAVASGLGSLIAMLIALLITPYVLSKLGNEVFGVWVVLLALVGYVGLADMGFGHSYVKHIAEFNARGDLPGVYRVMTVALLINTVLLALLLAAIWPTAELILELLGVEAGVRAEATEVFRLACVVLLWRYSIRIFECLIIGRQRVDITSAIKVVGYACTAVGTIFLLESGLRLTGLVLSQMIGVAMESVLAITIALRMYPTLTIRFKGIKELFPKLLRFGINMQAGRIAMLVNFQFDKLLISPVLGAAPVALFEIGNRLSVAARSLSMMPLGALFPASSAINTIGTAQELYQVYSHATRIIVLFGLPLFVGLGFGAPWIIKAWVGPGYETSVNVLRVICVGHFFNVLVGPVSPIVEGMGRPDIQRRAELINLSLNIALSVVLIFQFGIVGVALGTAIAMMITCAYYLRTFHQLLERSPLTLLRSGVLKPAMSALMAVTIAVVFAVAFDSAVPDGQIGSLKVAAVFGLVFSVGYCVLAVKLGALRGEDVATIFRHLRGVRALRRSPRK